MKLTSLHLCYLICMVFGELALTSTAWAQADLFWSHWGDGKAELSAYKTSQPRYGQDRDGYAVLIYVTEDLSKSAQVKFDKPNNSQDALKVLKLNHVKKFRTGIYDYNLMLSVFSPLAVWNLGQAQFKAVVPVKTSYSSQEWCGNYYEQLNIDGQGYKQTIHSYFEGEADKRNLFKFRPNMLLEDDLFIRVRELVAPFPAGSYPVLTSSMYSRLAGNKVHWTRADVVRKVDGPNLSTAIGDFKTLHYQVKIGNRVYKIWMENKLPRRILKWEIKYKDKKINSKETAEITGSKRVPYWQTTKLGDVKLREELGIVE